MKTMKSEYNEQDHTFIINVSGSVLAPEIAVFNGASTAPVDGRQTGLGNFYFPVTPVGSIGSTQTFTIKNTGGVNLTGLALAKTGSNSGDFILGTLGATTLASNVTTSFTVTFSPTVTGGRYAIVQIASNDGDENPFIINLIGTSVQLTMPPLVLTTFTNPTPAGSDYFAASVAAISSLSI